VNLLAIAEALERIDPRNPDARAEIQRLTDEIRIRAAASSAAEVTAIAQELCVHAFLRHGCVRSTECRCWKVADVVARRLNDERARR
jgi:hypothetical protein